jgi:Arc/MetJ-type ribon-helix-helix transcriptional regulator
MDGNNHLKGSYMSDTEKITINIGSVDLGKIDLLVQEGLYSNRADFIRTAIRGQLDKHEDIVKQSTVRRSMVVGVLIYSASDLEKLRAKSERLKIRVIGALVLHDDITPELAREVIENITVFGQIRARQDVKDALANRIQTA